MKSAAHLAMLLLVAAAAAGCDSPGKPLDAHELTLSAKTLASLSAEADLLTRQLGSGSVTPDFAQVHQDALQQESLKLARQLAKPVPDPLRSAHARALALNARLQTQLGQLTQARAQPAQLARLEQEFRRLKGEAKALEKLP
jgi:hypothetical protein